MVPETGTWLRWVTAEFGREGKVIDSRPPSMTVKWLGIDEPQVFPIATVHFGAHADMNVISPPANASEINRQKRGGHMGVADAAAALGTTEKRIRQRLRSGSLRGIQRDGRWVEVWVEVEE